MENADFAGRVAVVTGAWRGLGRAAAARLHERGASVAVNVRNRERAEALAKEIGERAFAVFRLFFDDIKFRCRLSAIAVRFHRTSGMTPKRIDFLLLIESCMTVGTKGNQGRHSETL